MAENHRSPHAQIQLGDAVLALGVVRQDLDRYRRLFEAARATEGHGLRLCREPAARLVIRRRSGRFWLAWRRRRPRRGMPVLRREDDPLGASHLHPRRHRGVPVGLQVVAAQGGDDAAS